MTAEHVTLNFSRRRKVHQRVEFPVKTGDRHVMAVGLEFTVGGPKTGWLNTFYVEPELLPIHSLEDTVIGPRIKLGEKPHRLSAYRQFNWNRDSSCALLAVIMRAPECECCCQVLPPCEVNYVPGLDARHKRGPSVTGDGCVDFPRGIPDRQQPIPVQRNPSTYVQLPVER